jgi:hypothetical protein
MVFFLRGLRNLPVLAKGTTEIASDCGYRERRRSRKKMVKGFFFDGIHMGSYDVPVNTAEEFPFSVFSHPTNPQFPGSYLAVMMA